MLHCALQITSHAGVRAGNKSSYSVGYYYVRLPQHVLKTATNHYTKMHHLANCSLKTLCDLHRMLQQGLITLNTIL